MIYWIIYDGGVGGDGFANMLEHATNIEPVDGVLKWRHEETPSSKIRFWYPLWVLPSQWFRWDAPQLKNEETNLEPSFIKLLEKNANMVIPVHKEFFKHAPKFPFQNVISHEHIKICLYSTNIDRVVEDYVDKQPGHEITNEKVEEYRILCRTTGTRYLPCSRSEKEKVVYINIDKAWSDWDYLNEILIQLGINLPREKYEEYLDISKRRMSKTV